MYFFDRFENLTKTAEESLCDELEQFMETRAFFDWQYGVQNQENVEQKILQFEPHLEQGHLFFKQDSL